MKKSPMPPRKRRLRARKGLERKKRLDPSLGGPKRSKGLRKANKTRRGKLWVRCFLSPEFVAFVQALPCACGCGRSPCEVSHDPSRGAGGTYKSAHPLYHECHRRLHSVGSETFWAEAGTTREAANMRTHGAWLEHSGT